MLVFTWSLFLTVSAMNSTDLKKAHRKVYEQFFFENHVVISAPFVMNRSGDVLNNYSWVWIKQKIPLRIYMGYTINSSSSIKLNKISYLDINEHTFIQANILEYAPYFTDLQKEIEKKYNTLTEAFGWIEINILSELPRGVWLGFGSIIPLLLSLLIHRLQETMTPSDILTLKSQNINNLLQDNYGQFAHFFLDALNLDKHMYGMVSSWTKLSSFFDTYYPVISFSEDCNHSHMNGEIRSTTFFGFKMEDMFQNLREVPYSPIDYGLIYSGKPVLLEQIAGDQYKNNVLMNKEIKSEFTSLWGDYLDQLPPGRRPRFYKHLIHPETDEFDLTYGKLMGIISLKILFFMSKIYRDGYDEFNVLQLLDSLKKLRQGDCVTRDSSSVFLKFISDITEHFHASSTSAKYLSLSPNDSTIMGWSLIFAMPLEWFRTSLINSVEHTSKEFTWSRMIYSNRIDGIEREGCKFDQDLKYGIYSEFLESNSCISRRVNGKVMISDCDGFIENYKSGLLLDTLHNKIYLDGQKLTSEHLHSQSGTIEIMKILIQNLGKEVSNKQLPSSSYSKNKNEMFGKIVIPLIDLIEKKTGKKLPLICKGSIYDFYVKLNKSDMEIVVIDRLDKEEFR